MGRNILLVEGSDDKHVMMHICGSHGIPKLDEIVPVGSVEQVLDHLPVRLKASRGDDDIVGVVVDADTQLNNRWHSIQQRIGNVGYRDIPCQPEPDGTILNPPEDTFLPKLGIWIMPNNQTSGILEDFLRFLVPEPNRLFDHAMKSVVTIPAKHQRFRDVDKPKALIHTWLAWQCDPGKPYGTAITARFLDPGVAEAQVLADWLRKLFFR